MLASQLHLPQLPPRPAHPSAPHPREKQAALAAEEARRREAAAAAAARFRADIGGQLSEKEAARQAAAEEKRRELEAMVQELEVRLFVVGRREGGARRCSKCVWLWRRGAAHSKQHTCKFPDL